MSSKPNITVSITADAKTKAGTDEAARDIESFAKKTSGFMVGVGAKVTEFGIGAAKDLVGMAGEFIGLGAQAELFGKKADTVFGTSSGDIKKWADSVNESFGLSDEAVVGLAANMGDLLKPMGFTEAATAEMTKGMLDSAGALSAWSGGAYDTAAVSDIMTKALLGETDGLKALGISISAAEVEMKALEMTGKTSAAALTAQEKALATQTLITEKSADAQKAWNDGTMDSVKKTNNMKAAFDDAKTAIGTGLLPIIQGLTRFMVDTMIPAGQQVVGWFQDNWPAIRDAVMSVVQPILDWFVANWPVIRDAVVEAFENIQAVVEVVLGVVKALWDVFGEYIMRYVGIVFDTIKGVVEAAMKVVKGIIDTVMGLITGDWGRVWDGIKSIFTGVWDGMQAILQGAMDQIWLVVSWAWDNVRGLFQGALDYVLGLPSYFANAALAVGTAIWNGIRDGIGSIAQSVGNLLSGVINKLGEFPSKMWNKAKEIGGDFVEGLKAGFGAVAGFAGDVASGVVDAVKDAWNMIAGLINDFIPNSLGWGMFSIDLPDNPIPRFHTGGIVPGPLGQEVFAVLKAGERVQTVGQQAAAGGSSGTTIYNMPPGYNTDQLLEAQRRIDRRGMNL